MLVALALTIAIYIIIILGVILIIRRINRPPDQELIASTSTRIAAFGIDFTLIVIIHDVMLSVLTGYPSIFLSSIFYSGFYAIFSLPIIVLSVMFSYLLFFLYLLIPYGVIYFSSTFYAVIVGFGYFLILETLSRGKTVGKSILRIRTVKRDGYSPISAREGVLNALGKSVILLWDLLGGIVIRSMRVSHTEQNQLRIMQRISDAVVINTRIDDTQPVQIEGPDWWQDQDSKRLDIWEEEKDE